MTTRAGTAIGCSISAVFGGVAAYIFWILCRLLGVSYGVELFRKAVYSVRVEYFVAIGAIIGIGLGFWRLRRRARSGGGMAVGHTP